MPKVSIIMNCLNGERYLREALDSVFAQTFQDWEIVFWDNCSTDKSGEIAKSYGEKLRYFRSETTVPIGAARDEAYKRCRGEYVAILDVDDVWLPEKLERQLPLLENNPEVGLVFSDTIYFDERGDRFCLFDMVTPKRGMVFGNLLVRNFITTVSMMYRRESLKTLNHVFNEKLRVTMDYDLSLRMSYFHKVDYVEKALTKWRMGSGGTRKNRFLFSKERKIIIEDMCRTYSKIRTDYGRELNRAFAAIYRQFAFEEWNNGNTSKARHYLMAYLKDPKCMAA